MAGDFDKLMDDAGEMTLKQVDARLASLIRLKDSEVNALFPSRPEKEKLIQLMKIVRRETSDNVKRRQLIDNIPGLADIVVKLLGKLA